MRYLRAGRSAPDIRWPKSLATRPGLQSRVRTVNVGLEGLATRRPALQHVFVPDDLVLLADFVLRTVLRLLPRSRNRQNEPSSPNARRCTRMRRIRERCEGAVEVGEEEEGGVDERLVHLVNGRG